MKSINLKFKTNKVYSCMVFLNSNDCRFISVIRNKTLWRRAVTGKQSTTGSCDAILHGVLSI